MAVAMLPKEQIKIIANHVKENKSTAAVIRTDHAPTELMPLLQAVAKACKLEILRTSWSPSADFGFAELNSKEKMLVVLWVGGAKTELISVSVADDYFVRDLEDAIHSSKFYSELVRHGT